MLDPRDAIVDVLRGYDEVKHIGQIADEIIAAIDKKRKAGLPVDDGGAAFPIIPPLGGDGFSANGYPFPEGGMTLRDWFAGQMLPKIGSGWPNLENRHILARQAYEMADAMIAARKAGK